MNDLLNDIKTLKAVEENLASVNRMDYTKKLIRNMIEEKQKIVSDFEKENMSYDQYADHMKNVGLNDVA
tara:strand:- start:169 stop:375 length:207 start_codon:yes stop_codon:yes gene_type:complete